MFFKTRTARPVYVQTRHWVPACAGILAVVTACMPRDPDGAQQDSSGALAAPVYSAVSLKGDSVSLESLEGNVVLVNIWATWCIPCREEMPLLQRLHVENESKGFKVVGISVDARGSEDRIEKFLDEHSITFPIWLDPDERASFVFRAIGVPASYLLSRDGRIVWRKLGPIPENDRELAAALTAQLSVQPTAGGLE